MVRLNVHNLFSFKLLSYHLHGHLNKSTFKNQLFIFSYKNWETTFSKAMESGLKYEKQVVFNKIIIKEDN